MIQTQYASFSKRLVAYLFDKTILAVISAVVLIPPISFFPRLFFDYSFFGFFSFGWGTVFVVSNWIYFTLFESSRRQATPGKLLMGIFVTDEFGRRLTLPRSLVRTLTKVISGMFCWLGYILALFTARSQALHDLCASSLVLEPGHGSASRYYPAGAPDSRTEMPGAPQPTPPGSAGTDSGTIQL